MFAYLIILFAYFTATVRRSWRLFIAIAKIIVPVMALVQIAQAYGLIDMLGALLGPVMGLANLPAEAGIVWATTILTGIYGGLASIASLSGSLELTGGQLSALAAMMLFAHNMPVEQSIVHRAGASFSLTAALRLLTASLYGAAVSWGAYWSGWLSETHSFEWLRGSDLVSGSGATGMLAWLQSITFSLALTFVVILCLVIVLDIFDRLGLTRRFTAAITPVLRLSGLNEQAAPVTTVGVLLGLNYGGALIIEEADKQGFSPRMRLLALSWLCLSHSLIEDTLLLVAIGADVLVIVVGRLIVTLLVIAAMARLTRRPKGLKTAGVR